HKDAPKGNAAMLRSTTDSLLLYQVQGFNARTFLGKSLPKERVVLCGYRRHDRSPGLNPTAGVCSISPGSQMISFHERGSNWTQPFQGSTVYLMVTQGSSPGEQPWAQCWNPFGVLARSRISGFGFGRGHCVVLPHPKERVVLCGYRRHDRSPGLNPTAGVCSISPGSQMISFHERGSNWTQPFQGSAFYLMVTQGSSPGEQPWAQCWNPFGVLAR